MRCGYRSVAKEWNSARRRAGSVLCRTSSKGVVLKRNLQSILWGRVSSIRKRVIKSKPRTRRTATGEATHPGFTDLSRKLTEARERLHRGGRHGRSTE